MKQLNWYQIFGKSNIPDGRTVLPTDDIQIWLNCADVWDKAYTTLYEVLNDTATLSALMASDNAVDYLVRSTTWAVPISVPVMTSNTTPSGVCIASSEDYPAYYAFNGNTSNGWTSVTVGTSNLGRVGYEFTEAVDIKKVSLLHANNANFTCKVQYSDDGVNWTDVEDSTFTAVKNTQANVSFDAGSHLYWAVYYLSASATTRASVNELQFYSASITTSADAMTYIGQNNYCANTLLADATWRNAICNSEYFDSVLNVKVPVMTSATTPSGQVYASPTYQVNYGYYAFDENANTKWLGSTPPASYSGNYIAYRFPTVKTIYMARIRQYSGAAAPNAQATADIQAGISNADFETVKSNITWYQRSSALNWYTFAFDTIKTNCDTFRILYISGTQSNALCSGMSELQFYGREDV